MSEENKAETNEVAESQEVETSEAKSPEELKLSGLYATKLGMATVYNDKGDAVPVTMLKFEPWKVTQVKTDEKDGYSAVQISARPKSGLKSNMAQKGHLKVAGFASNATFVREIRQKTLPENLKVGESVSINSLQKGDRVKLTSRSKGRGFSGAMKRHGFGGGPASHGSGFHRRPGSIGNCEFPGRVMPGRKMPGHFGDEKITMKNVEIVDVIADENVLLVKGGVPGARNTLVKLMKD